MMRLESESISVSLHSALTFHAYPAPGSKPDTSYSRGGSAATVTLYHMAGALGRHQRRV